MLSQESYRLIAEVFCGDHKDGFSYKSGPELVSFFNENFGYRDTYGQGFPSRWWYVTDKIIDLANKNKLNDFLNFVLHKRFVLRDNRLEEVQALEKIETVLNALNTQLNYDGYKVIKVINKYRLVSEDSDLVPIGSGGFAEVFKRKSTGVIVKKLKEDYLSNKEIRSRFKREYEITKSLYDIYGVVEVYEYYLENCSYTMEAAEQTLYDFIINSDFSDDTRITMIRQILYIVKQVHDRNIIHRDLSPTNILIVNGVLKIADFGLGKDLNIFHSHKTIYTNAVGQYYYCAPEQFMLLREGDKKSDVYSLGRIVNFLLTKSPVNNHHFLKAVVEKATNENPSFRYKDAGEMIQFVEKSIIYHTNEKNMEDINGKLLNKVYDESIENYIYELSGDKIVKGLISVKGMSEALIKFTEENDERALYIIQSIEREFTSSCTVFESFDPIANFAYQILIGGYSFVTKEIAAGILKHIAYDVRRFSAQRLIEKVVDIGIEPLLEEVLTVG